jgi:hypothetical protein
VIVPGGLSIDRVLIGYTILVGIAAGVVLVAVPAAQEFRLPPYFWILAAIGVFDLAAYARGQGAPGTMAAMRARVFGFVIALVLMVLIPVLFGAGMPKIF